MEETTSDVHQSVTERLYQDASMRIEKNLRQRNNHIHEMKSHMSATDPHTFQPVISDTSKYLVGQNDLYRGDFKDF